MQFASIKKVNHYKIGVLLSSISMLFGILREFLIVSLLGFSAINDSLQLYLSLFYTVGLTIDAMRLACINLYSLLTLPKIIASASIIALPFTIFMGCIMYYSTQGMNFWILVITILGAYLNLIVALMLTYKQRQDNYLATQFVSILPNLILIPGIIACYWLATNNLILAIVSLVSLIPIIQLLILLRLPNSLKNSVEYTSITMGASVMLIIRHFTATLGEQLFQVLLRTAFFKHGTGYLSLYAMLIRIYATIRFILIDSYIGAKLAKWKKELHDEDHVILKLMNSNKLSLFMVGITFLLSLYQSDDLQQSTIQITLILIIGFYFSTLVRIVYFKINRHEINALMVMRFASYEFIVCLCGFILTYKANYSIFSLIWLGYIIKPYLQLAFLRKKFINLISIEEGFADDKILQKTH